MTTRIIAITAAALALVFSSCRPIGDPPAQVNPPVKKLTPEEEAKKKEEEARLKAEEEIKKKAEEEAKKREIQNVDDQPPVNPPPPPPPGPRPDYPFANKVPGKDGFVFSPYNNKVVDVRDIASGTLVADPTYPAAEKKYFRVP